MRGKKEAFGGMTEGMKTKGRKVEHAIAGKGLKTAAKISGRAEGGHGGLSGSRKSNVRKGSK